MMATILTIAAHPDDAEQFAGGTMILLRKLGWEVHIAAMTRGENGIADRPIDAVVAIRQEEGQAGAEAIGATYHTLGERDGCLAVALATVTKVVGLIRRVRPDVILTHPVIDYMADHEHTGKLTRWAVPEALHTHFPANADEPPLEHRPAVYHFDPQDLVGADGQFTGVNMLVDISEVMEEKLTAFRKHESQITDERAEKTRRYGVIRGHQAGVMYAEGFNQYLASNFSRRNLLAETLGEKVMTL